MTEQDEDAVTTDDILDSLTRQAELRQKLEEREPLRLEEISETEDMNRGLNPEPPSNPVVAATRSIGHYAFVFMLLGGLVVVWLYSSVTKRFDLVSLNEIIQRSGIVSIFASLAQFAVIALGAALGALWVRYRRRSSSLHRP